MRGGPATAILVDYVGLSVHQRRTPPGPCTGLGPACRRLRCWHAEATDLTRARSSPPSISCASTQTRHPSSPLSSSDGRTPPPWASQGHDDAAAASTTSRAGNPPASSGVEPRQPRTGPKPAANHGGPPCREPEGVVKRVPCGDNWIHGRGP
jgi:hypothetical protein